MNKVLQYIKKIKDLRFGTIRATTIAAQVIDEQMVFQSERFVLTDACDIFGNKHPNFAQHEAITPSFFVRCFENAYCFTNREEIFSSNKDVIAEYTAQSVNPKIGQNKKPFYRTKRKFINGSAAHLSISGMERNYYHFLTEGLARLYLLECSKFKPDYYIVANNHPFQADILELLGITRDRIIPTIPEQLLQVKTLIVPDLINNWRFIYFNGFKDYQKQWQPAWTVNLYRNRLKLMQAENAEQKKIHISRDKANCRQYENPEAVNALFNVYGFETCYLENMNITQQMQLFANAGHIAGIHGAGFANLYFTQPGTKVFEIFPKHYHDNSYRILATILDLDYHYMIAESNVPDDVNPQNASLQFELDVLRQALATFVNK